MATFSPEITGMGLPAKDKRRSLVRRLIWGVVGVSLLGFAVQAAVLTMWLQPMGEQFFNSAANQARLTRIALRSAAPEDRATLAREINRERLTLSQTPLAGMDQPPQHKLFEPPEFKTIAMALQQEGIEMRLHDNDGSYAAIVFRLPVGEETWWLHQQVRRPTTAVTQTLTLWLLMMGVATAGALLWSVRAISRPLADLAGQLNEQQGHLKPLQEDRYTSRELDTVVKAFNALVHQVSFQNQVRQQLLAGVSHDLRTPLARLRLRVETQCADELASELTADLLALEHIVDQFLAYVQGDTDSPQGQPRPLAECVREVVAPYVAAGQPVSLHMAQPGPAQLLEVPHLAVRRLLANLVDNALAYGRAPVTVVLQDHAAGIDLQVWDQGRGMSEDEFVHAQRPFVRLGGSRPDVGHCGLGLAIATQMARQLGGRLTLAHDPTLGFGIVLRLPTARA
jgi:two-component system osmolarity sensor histidine kinase EnvZ